MADDAERWLKERNAIARQHADALDDLAALKDEFAAFQERVVLDMAALRLATGKSIEDVSDTAYDDKEQVAQRLKDKCWNEGYIEGLYSAARHLDDYRITENEALSREKTSAHV